MKRMICLLVVIILTAHLLATTLTDAVGSDAASPDWAMPGAMSIKRVGPLPSTQSTPNNLDNLDCTPIKYRLVTSSTLQEGCFTQTALGMYSSDDRVGIFRGTDEATPILAYSPNQVLAPWPEAPELISLDPVNTGGSYISIYKNPLAVMQDQRDLLLRLTAKQFVAPPSLQLKDPSGQRLVINSQTMAFSDGGSWLVAETLGNSFVRINLATLDVTAFALPLGMEGDASSLQSRVAVSDDGRFVAIANEAGPTFKVYDLATCSGPAINLKPQNCRSYDYRPFAQSQIASLQKIRHVRFINKGLLSFEARTGDATSAGAYELAPTASITSLTDYIGLGDSYTSGEGAFDYLTGTDTSSDTCHLSARSYPLLLTHDLFSSAGGHSVACSGAVINDVGNNSDDYKGQVRGGLSYKQLQQNDISWLTAVTANFTPGYIAQQRFVRQYQPRVATIEIGGNDIGFGDLVETCVMPHISRHLSDSTCFNTYEARQEVVNLIDRTVARWVKLYKQLQAEAPNSHLYAIGYPQIVKDDGKCAVNVVLNKSELEFAVELVNYLNDAIRQAADQAGVNYIDVGQALAGHRLCEAASYDVAVNGLTAGGDAGPFGKESYHPNVLGHQLIEQVILRQTHNFTLPASESGPSADQAKLLNAPKSGRQINDRIPVNNLAPQVIKKGDLVTVNTTGLAGILKPSAAYSIHLDGPTGPIIGSVSSDEAGNASGTVIISNDVASGGHTVDVIGEGQIGQPIDVTQPVYVPASDSDTDGDGIPNDQDHCPAVINSGQDGDQDGLDDICDPLIGQVTTDGQNSSPDIRGGLASNDSMPLDPAAPTVVATFSVPLSVLPASKPVAFDKNNQSGVLGAATINPTQTDTKDLRSPLKIGADNSPRPYTKLKIINLLPWVILVFIAWLLLLVMTGLLKRWADRSIKTRGFGIK